MVKTAFLAGCILLCFFAFTQNEVDSIKHTLQKNAKRDSLRVKSLLNLSNIIVWQQPSEAMRYADSAFQLAEKLDWQKGVALSLRQKGLVFYATADLLNAADFTLKASNAGAFMHNPLFNASIDNNLANIYADMGDYAKALDYYRNYLNISRQLHDDNNEMNALINIGNIYAEQNKLTKALDYTNNGLTIAKKLNNKTIAGVALNNIGVIYKKLNKDDSAENAFNKSILLAEETKNNSSKATALTELAQIYLKHGDQKKAIAYATQSLTLSNETADLEWQRDARQALSQAYEKEHNLPLAYKFYKEYIQIRDSILNNEKKQELVKKEMQYGFDKQQSLARAEQDKKEYMASAALNKQRYLRSIITLIAITLITSLLAIFYFYKRKRDAVEQRKDAEFRAQVLDTEMKVLRLQMNPHFIFNSLNSISDYINKNDLRSADSYLTKFAKVMRYILENADQKEVPLVNDLKALDCYMQLESLRLNNQFIYEINVDPSIDQEATLVPPLMLQPFVENSIWHGMAKKNGKGRIKVIIRKENEMLLCIIEDDGIGRQKISKNIPQLQNSEHKSVGVKITRSRIELINKQKNTNATVELQDLVEGLRVNIKLPLEMSF